MAGVINLQDDVKRKLKEANIYEEILEDLKKCKTNQSRVKLVSENQIIQEVMKLSPLHSDKSGQLSVQFRNEGNQYFQKGEYQMALNKYNQSVLFAPVVEETTNTNLELSYALANRSAVFFHQKRYQTCLDDIEASICNKYPKSLIYKLHERRGKCYLELKDYQKAHESFQNALNSFEDADLDSKKLETVKNLTLKNIEKCKTKSAANSSRKDSVERFHGPIPSIEKRSDSILCASDVVCISKDDETEFGLKAGREILVGEVLIVEKAYSSIVLPKFDKIYCHHCCNRVVAAYPCTHCTEVMYCSPTCSKESWDTYHSFECVCLKRVKEAKLGLGYLALKMVLKAGLDRVLGFKNQEKEDGSVRSIGLNSSGAYDSEDYQTVYSLVNHSEKRTAEDLFTRSVQATFLLKCLEDTEFFKKDGVLSNDDKYYVAGHILRHIMMLPCNAHEVSELAMKPNNLPESETIEIGSGIYPVLSLINHSCDPNVVRHSYGNTCVVRAIKNISQGEEIVDNYGALYPITVQSERRATLQGQYFFTCNCKPCREDWPLYFNIPADVPKFRCQKCNGPVIIPPDRKTENSICTSCGNKQDITDIIVKLHQSQMQYQEVLEQILRGERLQQAVPKVEKYLQFLCRSVCLPWQDCNNCQEAIKQCYAVQANCFIVS